MTDAQHKPGPGVILPLVLGFGPGMAFLLGYLVAPAPEQAPEPTPQQVSPGTRPGTQDR